MPDTFIAPAPIPCLRKPFESRPCIAPHVSPIRNTETVKMLLDIWWLTASNGPSSVKVLHPVLVLQQRFAFVLDSVNLFLHILPSPLDNIAELAPSGMQITPTVVAQIGKEEACSWLCTS